MKKILPIAACAFLAVSCSSNRAGVVDSTIAEAKTLQELSKAVGLDVPAGAGLITDAEKQNDARQTEQAFVMADEAILQYQLSMLKNEEAVLANEKNNAESALTTSKESLDIYRDALDKQRNTPKQVAQ